MKVSLKDQTITVSLQEMAYIIEGRKKAAMMDTIMNNGKENPLSVSYNDGVKIMSKYMADYFMNEFDQADYEAKKNGGEY